MTTVKSGVNADFAALKADGPRRQVNGHQVPVGIGPDVGDPAGKVNILPPVPPRGVALLLDTVAQYGGAVISNFRRAVAPPTPVV